MKSAGRPLGATRYREFARDIHDSGMHLLSIINDILDLAKIEAGKMQVRLTEFSVYDVCDGLLAMFGAPIGLKACASRDSGVRSSTLYGDDLQQLHQRGSRKPNSPNIIAKRRTARRVPSWPWPRFGALRRSFAGADRVRLPTHPSRASTHSSAQ